MLAAMRFLVGCALMAYAAVLLFILFSPSSDVPSGLVEKGMSLGVRLDAPEAWVERARVEFGLNVLAFLPISLLGSLLRPTITVSTWIALGFVGSMLVEAIQTTMPDRMATHSDVVANTLGAALGAMVAWALVRPFRSEARADLPDLLAAAK